MGMTKYVHLEGCRVIRDTEKAILIEYNGEQHWLPRSVVSNGDNYEQGDKDLTISIPEKWANEKGIEVDS